MEAKWEHACRLFQAGLVEESRQVIHRLRVSCEYEPGTPRHSQQQLSNSFYQLCCARCSVILFPSVTCSVRVEKWSDLRTLLLARRKEKGLFVARFKQTVLISTVCLNEKTPKRLTGNDYVVVYNCHNCKYDLIYDNFAFQTADLEPSLQTVDTNNTGSVPPKVPTDSSKKTAIKQILGKRTVPEPPRSGLDLNAFLKRL